MKKSQPIINSLQLESGRSPTQVLSDESRLREDLAFDSLELAVLTVKIEAEFGVDVFADGMVHTVGDIEEKIRKHQGEK